MKLLSSDCGELPNTDGWSNSYNHSTPQWRLTRRTHPVVALARVYMNQALLGKCAPAFWAYVPVRSWWPHRLGREERGAESSGGENKSILRSKAQIVFVRCAVVASKGLRANTPTCLACLCGAGIVGSWRAWCVVCFGRTLARSEMVGGADGFCLCSSIVFIYSCPSALHCIACPRHHHSPFTHGSNT